MDRVVLRRWKTAHKEAIALFPDEVTADGLVTSYMHIGQHGGANYGLVIQATRPLPESDPEAQELLAELRRIGYEPKVMRRRQPY